MSDAEGVAHLFLVHIYNIFLDLENKIQRLLIMIQIIISTYEIKCTRKMHQILSIFLIKPIGISHKKIIFVQMRRVCINEFKLKFLKIKVIHTINFTKYCV